MVVRRPEQGKGAVVPLLTLMLALFSVFPAFQGFGDHIENLLLDHLLPNSGREIQAYIEAFAEQSRNLTWVGAGMLVATAILMLRDVESSFNTIWGVIGARSAVLDFFPILLTTGAFMLLYTMVPNCWVSKRHALTGAIVVVLVLKMVQCLPQ